MQKEYKSWHSPSLGRDMEILRYGYNGTPILVFPSSKGRYYEWEGFKMIDALSYQIESGYNQVFCIDSVDAESFYNRDVHPYVRIKRHQQYEAYVATEVIPHIQDVSKHDFVIATGASFGAYHATNMVLKYPKLFGKLIAMSGSYDIKMFFDGFYNDDIYFSNPIDYLPNLSDNDTLEAIRANHLVLTYGEHDPCRSANENLIGILDAKGIKHHSEMWHGFGHDWDWWQKMILQHIG